MNSRTALSALLILIATMVLASQGAGLLKKIKVLQASWVDKVSETQSLLIFYRSCDSGNRPRAAEIPSPSSKTAAFSFSDATHCLDAQARHLQRFVLNLIDADHQGE